VIPSASLVQAGRRRAIYQALLTGLRTEVLRRRGEIDRATQVQTIAGSVWESVKQGAAVSIVLGVVLLVFPWLSLPLTLLGFVGMGKASLDLFHAFWDGLSEEQRAELHRAAYEAGVDLRRMIAGDRGGDAAPGMGLTGAAGQVIPGESPRDGSPGR
jgi:hypothetical protein